MREKLNKVWELLTSKQKKDLLFFLFIAFFLSFLELLGIGLIIPFLMILTENNYQDYLFMQNFIDFFKIDSQKDLVIVFLLIIFFVFFTKNILNVFFVFLKNKTFFQFFKDIEKKCMENYLKMPYKYFIKLNSSQLVNTLNSEIEYFVLGVLDPIVIICIEALSIFAIFLVLFYVEPTGTIFLVLLTLFIFVIFYKLIGNKVKKIGTERLELQNKVQKIVIQSLHGIKDIKIVNAEKNFLLNFYKKIDQLINKQTKQKFFSDIPRYIIEVLVIFFLVILSLIILYQGKNVSELLVIVGVFAGAGFRIMPSLNRLILATQSIKFSNSVIDLIHHDTFALKFQNENLLNKKNKQTLKKIDKLEFQNVSFKYNENEKFIFENINLQISKNDFIGIYGESGAGKSTFVDILSGLLEPTSGKLVLNTNEDYKDIMNSGGEYIGYVPQNIYLNDESICSNIALGENQEDIDKSKINQAIDRAKLRTFVDGLKDKENTLIGDRGIKISGGQRQRIGIARALYRKSEILIFDESTSSLDKKTEDEFLEVVKDLSENTLIILISHKPNTLKYCNKIFKIVNNKIISEKK
tara:strand:- start:2640 stop:4379 length:1740 start_codon:yes stop_codon:yes gene_type:complete